jgi:hypothetical protein
MILWYAVIAVALVWNVFQSSGIDMRFVAAGALLPLVLDTPFGEQAFAHALVAPIAAMTVVMLATVGRGHRLVRRRLLGVPIGWFCGLILSFSWQHPEVFWWPLFGLDRPHVDLLPAWWVVALREAVGLAVAVWCYRRFGLDDARRRAQLWRTGRVGVAAP